MTTNDFQEWYAYHSKAFPGVADWMKKHPETIRFWEMPFEHVELADAKAASREMVTGDLEEPKGFGQHAKAIARRAREIGFARKAAPQAVDGESVYGCPTCQDAGLVAVVDPRAYRAGQFRACSVYCACHAGDVKQNRKFSDGHRAVVRPRFDSTKMFRLDYEEKASDQKAAFAEWLARRIQNHPGYTDFGEYSHETQEAF